MLEIDADERVSPELRDEIERFLADPPADVDLAACRCGRSSSGHPLGPSAKYPKYRHRLLRRGAYRHDEARTVHEGFIPEGPVHPFEGDLMHLLATSWSEAVRDAWRYARLEAGQLRGRTHAGRVDLTGALLRPAVKLLYRLAIDGGWRDGWPGLARISLDCATDSVVWTRHLLGRAAASGAHPAWGRARITARAWTAPRAGRLQVGRASPADRARGRRRRALARARAGGGRRCRADRRAAPVAGSDATGVARCARPRRRAAVRSR